LQIRPNKIQLLKPNLRVLLQLSLCETFLALQDYRYGTPLDPLLSMLFSNEVKKVKQK